MWIRETFDWMTWTGDEPADCAGRWTSCGCALCQADDSEDYTIYVFTDRRALMWEMYQRNHLGGQPRG